MRSDYLLYPSLQGPVLTAAQRPETVTESRWHQPWSEPRGRTNAWRARRAAVALIASGVTFNPLPITGSGADPTAIDKYLTPLSEPVRAKPRLHTAAQAFHGFVQASPFEERIEPGKWFAPLSEPVRVKPALRASLQQAFATDPQRMLDAEYVYLDKYLLPLSEPVRLKPGLHASLQQTLAIDPRRLLDQETVTEDRWHQPWSEPVQTARRKDYRRLLAAQQMAFAPVSPFALTQPETVTLSRFLLPLSEPVRVKRALRAAAHLSFSVSPTALITAEAVRIDKFLLPLSEPVRFKPGLGARYQLAFSIDAFALTLRRSSARAYIVV